jgi:hypothetical protein
MSKYNVQIHDKPLKQEFDYIEEKSASEPDYMHDYMNDLDAIDDDYDVDVSHYIAPVEFRKFILYPFKGMTDYKSIMCKTGLVKLPKKIITLYKEWNFENYHQMELMSLLYLHYYRDCEEWKKASVVQTEINTILEALPHFKNITELFTYAVANNDIKLTDFDQVIEVDDHGAKDITGRL